MRPDSVLELCGEAIAFWASQERTHAEYHAHLSKHFENRKEQVKEESRRALGEMQEENARMRKAKEASDARCEELKHELQLVNQKYQEETHKVRMLQERMIDSKRRRSGSGMASPVREGGATPERAPPGSDFDRVSRSPLRKPAHNSGVGTVIAPRGGLVAASRAPTPIGLGGGGFSGGGLGGGGGGGGGLGGGGNSVRRSSYFAPGSLQQNATPVGSRLSTPVHRSASFLSPVPGLGGGGLSGWGSSGRR